jgi:hypothetical protein
MILARSRPDQLVLEDRIEFLSDYPKNREVGETPIIVRTEGRHLGRMLMIKGKFVFFEDEADSQLKMLELPDVVSRYIEPRGRKP